VIETKALITKADEDQHLVWGVVYAPNVPDSDGEFMDAETIRKMAYDFMREMRNDQVDVQHTNQIPEDTRIVESFIVRKGDPDFPEGAWVACAHIPDPVTWDKVKKQQINGFSIEAHVHKESVAVEVDLPTTMQGTTHKSEDHAHTFYVTYDEQGRFIGGRTDNTNGHHHIIKRGTLTEEANGHAHRFSHLEGFQLTEPN